MFDSEHGLLMQNASIIEAYTKILDDIVKHSVVLFFMTDDDRQLGLRFVTQEEAIDFLNDLDDIDKLLNHPSLQSNRSKQSN